MGSNQKQIDFEKERRKIKAVALMKKIMKRYYFRAKTAKWRRKKVAWITSGGPVEPLIAMNVIPMPIVGIVNAATIINVHNMFAPG